MLTLSMPTWKYTLVTLSTDHGVLSWFTVSHIPLSMGQWDIDSHCGSVHYSQYQLIMQRGMVEERDVQQGMFIGTCGIVARHEGNQLSKIAHCTCN